MAIKNYITDQKYFKPDYYKALQFIVPNYLLEDDQRTFGDSIDIKDQIINSHISVADNVSSLLNISSVPGIIYSSINTLPGLAPFFVKQNEISKITPEDFELSILDKVDASYKKFRTEELFKEYLSGTLLPSITLNKPTEFFRQGDSISATHQYLIENISWLYFLNTSGPVYSPSSFVCNLLVEKLYKGENIYLNDCLKGLSEYLFKNNFNDYIPDVFLSSTGKYTSGTQQLDKLNTWIDIIYSPLYSDNGDLTVFNKFDLAIQNGVLEENKIIDGPFSKFLRLLSLAAYDISDNTQRLKTLYNINECPDDFLPFISDLLGWKLFGSDPDRWRLQLRNIIEVYKKAGTKKSLQFALNTVFPKNIFFIQSDIKELWESYIPFIILYSLLTESVYFKSNETWTRELAERMKVEGYANDDIRENAKLVTDRIVYEIFLIHKQKFNIPNITNEFLYRGRSYPIPPFEEIPYYANVELDEDMINLIVDRLVCFGVRREFAFQVGDYIKNYTIKADDFPRSSSWLFFSAKYNQPPNLRLIIDEADSKKLEFVPLWSGKSSHFNLSLNASSFDFTKKETTFESADAPDLASRAVKEFAPAHAIPIIVLNLSAAPDNHKSSDVHLPIIGIDKIENLESSLISNYEMSGLNVSSYKRSTGTGNKMFPGPQTSLVDPLLVNATVATNVPRNTIRRRNFEKLMPMNGYYDRTGFNMPVSFDPSASLSGIYLGYIPSSHSFKSIPDYKNLPEVYSICINTSSVIYGYQISSTVKCRGHVNLGYKDYYTDRGQLNDIYYVMHSINEGKKVIQASSILREQQYITDESWRNNVRSYVNSATEFSGWTPVSVNDYYNFKYGRELHLLYQTYTKQFNRHLLSDEIITKDGPNIISHTYGPIIYNHDFDTISDSQYIVKTLSATDQIKNSNILSIPGATVASTAGSLYFTPSAPDIIISSIVSGIDLIAVSGGSTRNSFTVVRVPMSEKPKLVSEYMFDRTFIKVDSVNSFPRIRIDITKDLPSPSYGFTKNFLLPDHMFKLSMNGLVCSNDGLKLGGRSMAIWIHTKQENNKIWSFIPITSNLTNCKNKLYGVWVQHARNLRIEDILDNYVHKINFPEIDRTVNEDVTKFRCIDIVKDTGYGNSPLLTLEEKDFSNFDIIFDTYNNIVDLEPSYYASNGQLHRKTQQYLIDIFFLPDSINGQKNFFLIDKVSIVDMTLNKMSQLPAIKEYSCDEQRYPLTKEQLKSIFRHFNDISGKNSQVGIASRDAFETSGVMLAQGGSRLDYRTNTSWHGPTYVSTGKTIDTIEVKV